MTDVMMDSSLPDEFYYIAIRFDTYEEAVQIGDWLKKTYQFELIPGIFAASRKAQSESHE